MTFFTSSHEGKSWPFALVALYLLFPLAQKAWAQGETKSPGIPGPGQISLDSNTSATNAAATNVPPVLSVAAPSPEPAPAPVATPAPPWMTQAPASTPPPTPSVPIRSILGALMTLASFGGFILYYCGLTRAKNSGHTSTLLLVGVIFGLTGFWIGGFALQTGGIGDTHAALAQQVLPAEQSALDHELGPILFGHHWGIMGSSGFFLATDDSTRNGIAALFLVQAAWLAIAIAAALGAALERGRLLALAFCSYQIGVLVYPLLANWVWGGGWLAELGREFGLGHGFVDLGGACVVHQTAGIVALVMAIVLGPRHGRFGRGNAKTGIPGHNVPFLVLGSIVLLVSWMSANAFACAGIGEAPAATDPVPLQGLAAINTLLAAMGGLVVTFVQGGWQKKRPEPARLCRGLLGGAVASCGCAGIIDPWAAFLIGGVAGALVQFAMEQLERKRIDDPVCATAVHGAGGAWGVLATGLFANGSAGYGLNGVSGPIRGLFFGGAWHQLAAQMIGCVMGFAAIALLGWASVSLVQKILGNRVDLADESAGLDLTETGALGYQGDIEAEETEGKNE